MRFVFLFALLLVGGACSPAHVRGTEIEYTAERQEVADVVEEYRLAVEARDDAALQKLASERYYENGSTTSDPGDDYDYRGLKTILGDIKVIVKAIKYEIDINLIEVVGDSAYVDFDYRSQYLFQAGETDKWATSNDKNRISLRREKGEWRIISGM